MSFKIETLIQIMLNKKTNLDNPLSDKNSSIRFFDFKQPIVNRLTNIFNTNFSIKSFLARNPKLYQQVLNMIGLNKKLYNDLVKYIGDVEFHEPEQLLENLKKFVNKQYKGVNFNVYKILANQDLKLIIGSNANNGELVKSNKYFCEFSTGGDWFHIAEADISIIDDVNDNGISLYVFINLPWGDNLLLSFVQKKVYKYDEQIRWIGYLFKKTLLPYLLKDKMSYINARYREPLTGLYNKRYIQDVASVDNCYSIISIDLDHFKELNDSNGHIFGDEILKGIAKLLKSNIKHYDRACRSGGDEFLLLIKAYCQEEIEIIITRIRQQLDKFNSSLKGKDNKALKVGMTIGYKVYDKDKSFDDMAFEADIKMLSQKGSHGVSYRLVKILEGQKDSTISLAMTKLLSEDSKYKLLETLQSELTILLSDKKNEK